MCFWPVLPNRTLSIGYSKKLLSALKHTDSFHPKISQHFSCMFTHKMHVNVYHENYSGSLKHKQITNFTIPIMSIDEIFTHMKHFSYLTESLCTTSFVLILCLSYKLVELKTYYDPWNLYYSSSVLTGMYMYMYVVITCWILDRTVNKYMQKSCGRFPQIFLEYYTFLKNKILGLEYSVLGYCKSYEVFIPINTILQSVNFNID